jgi:hypothetical protein
MDDTPIIRAVPEVADSAAPLQTLPGRPADLWAALIASAGAILAVGSAIAFFLGFAENDTRWEHLLSALILTVGLFVLAVAPFAIVAGLARAALRRGGRLRDYGWTLFLMLPWLALSGLAIAMTPLPIWFSASLAVLSGLLCLWAAVSLCLDWRNTSAGPNVDTTEDEPEPAT